LYIKITNQTERCITLTRQTDDFRDAFNNFMDDNFGFQPIDADDLNGIHGHIQPNQNPLLQAMDNVG